MLNLRKVIFVGAMIALVVFPATVLAEPITIDWWFAHGGRLGEKVQEIVANYNASQSEYKVVATYKGNYTDTMNAGIAAFRSKTPPHILQVFEVGTASMMAASKVSWYSAMMLAALSMPPSRTACNACCNDQTCTRISSPSSSRPNTPPAIRMTPIAVLLIAV